MADYILGFTEKYNMTFPGWGQAYGKAGRAVQGPMLLS